VLNYGGSLKSVRALAVVFHLWHRSTWSFANEKFFLNKEILERRIAQKEFRCENGIVSLGADSNGDAAGTGVRS
jgi:hypothetical protein